jgi:hypothetical protein
MKGVGEREKGKEDVQNRRLQKPVINNVSRHPQRVRLGLIRELGSNRTEDFPGDVAESEGHESGGGDDGLEDGGGGLTEGDEVCEGRENEKEKERGGRGGTDAG